MIEDSQRLKEKEDTPSSIIQTDKRKYIKCCVQTDNETNVLHIGKENENL
jgi:hypothetical protein